ncbi:MAG: response regulator transcription factor [Agriterribacter sp.]
MNNTKYVAIVDDHTMFRRGLALLINQFVDYKVLFDARDGNDFIKQLKPQHLPDIVLVDIMMSGMDGYATAQWIHINFPEIKTLALSSMDSEAAIIRMIKSGAKGYVLKDAEPHDLRRAFENVLNVGYYYNDKISQKIIRSVSALVDDHNPVDAFARLTEKEVAFIKLCCTEKSYVEIAKQMYVSERTIDGYRETMFKKLGVHTRVGLVLYAFRNGIVQP